MVEQQLPDEGVALVPIACVALLPVAPMGFQTTRIEEGPAAIDPFDFS